MREMYCVMIAVAVIGDSRGKGKERRKKKKKKNKEKEKDSNFASNPFILNPTRLFFAYFLFLFGYL